MKHFIFFHNLFCFKYNDKLLVPKIYTVYSIKHNIKQLAIDSKTMFCTYACQSICHTTARWSSFKSKLNILTKTYNIHVWTNMLISPGWFRKWTSFIGYKQQIFLVSIQEINERHKSMPIFMTNKRLTLKF